MKRKKVLGIILGTVAVVLLVLGVIQLNYSLGGIGKYVSERIPAKNETQEELQPTPEIVEPVIEEPKPQIPSPEPEEPEIPKEPEPERIENPYSEYYLQNEDMAAWLYIPDTPIDYPVMYTPEDEEYYLNRGFDKKNSANGCLILDTDSCLEPLSDNLIIHGHCMKNGDMFGTLAKYENEDYCKEHPLIYLYDKDREHIYEVIAVFRSQVFYTYDTVFKYYKFFNAQTEEEFDDFYDNIKEMSVYDTGIEAEYGDKFITLSTCAYHVQNGRFVVVAKEIDTGDYYLPPEEKDIEKESEIDSNNM